MTDSIQINPSLLEDNVSPPKADEATASTHDEATLDVSVDHESLDHEEIVNESVKQLDDDSTDETEVLKENDDEVVEEATPPVTEASVVEEEPVVSKEEMTPVTEDSVVEEEPVVSEEEEVPPATLESVDDEVPVISKEEIPLGTEDSVLDEEPVVSEEEIPSVTEDSVVEEEPVVSNETVPPVTEESVDKEEPVSSNEEIPPVVEESVDEEELVSTQGGGITTEAPEHEAPVTGIEEATTNEKILEDTLVASENEVKEDPLEIDPILEPKEMSGREEPLPMDELSYAPEEDIANVVLSAPPQPKVRHDEDFKPKPQMKKRVSRVKTSPRATSVPKTHSNKSIKKDRKRHQSAPRGYVSGGGVFDRLYNMSKPAQERGRKRREDILKARSTAIRFR